MARIKTNWKLSFLLQLLSSRNLGGIGIYLGFRGRAAAGGWRVASGDRKAAWNDDFASDGRPRERGVPAGGRRATAGGGGGGGGEVGRAGGRRRADEWPAGGSRRAAATGGRWPAVGPTDGEWPAGDDGRPAGDGGGGRPTGGRDGPTGDPRTEATGRLVVGGDGGGGRWRVAGGAADGDPRAGQGAARWW
ncbi:uncharacterized protein A4U43_C08F30360 [Asparagus officinalis]|nr:uncharacterized protein A4U43_C08F30360 [Asparagus officinalis]